MTITCIEWFDSDIMLWMFVDCPMIGGRFDYLYSFQLKFSDVKIICIFRFKAKIFSVIPTKLEHLVRSSCATATIPMQYTVSFKGIDSFLGHQIVVIIAHRIVIKIKLFCSSDEWLIKQINYLTINYYLYQILIVRSIWTRHRLRNSIESKLGDLEPSSKCCGSCLASKC